MVPLLRNHPQGPVKGCLLARGSLLWGIIYIGVSTTSHIRRPAFAEVILQLPHFIFLLFPICPDAPVSQNNTGLIGGLAVLAAVAVVLGVALVFLVVLVICCRMLQQNKTEDVKYVCMLCQLPSSTVCVEIFVG